MRIKIKEIEIEKKLKNHILKKREREKKEKKIKRV